MKPWPLLFAGFGLAGAAWSSGEEPYVFLLTGDTDGYLSPCGCTKPMTGGVLRRLTAIKQMTVEGRTVILENGGLIAGTGRQDVLKAETLAQLYEQGDYTAVNYGPSEAALGQGLFQSLMRLSGDRLTSASVAPSPSNELKKAVVKGPFLIGGVSVNSESVAVGLAESPVALEDAVDGLVNEAAAQGLLPILMLRGDREAAASLAKSFPALRLIQYRSAGDPPSAFERVGQTVLVTPGESGKHVLRLSFKDGEFSAYTPVRLAPSFEDDKDARRVYHYYLDRVGEEGLLDKLPRAKTDPFAGNKACGSCHGDAMKTWKDSQHASALHTLEVEKHDRDPDCVSCHVVGLESEFGFRSRKDTPDLTDVGCESCHGPGKAHADSPYTVKMPKFGERACTPCHTPQQSPNFDFPTYWAKIKHK